MTRSTVTSCTRPAAALRPTELAALRVMLEQQRAFRLEQLEQLDSRGGALASADTGVARSLADAARAALQEVQHALTRMAAGTYGRCAGCGRPLERERLEILPQTAQCLSCARPAMTSRAAG